MPIFIFFLYFPDQFEFKNSLGITASFEVFNLGILLFQFKYSFWDFETLLQVDFLHQELNFNFEVDHEELTKVP